jgi:N-acetylneuraminate synthase
VIRVIAEVGINHDGNLERAIGLQESAAQAGAWAVKYQIRTDFEAYTPRHLWDTTRRWHGEDLPYREYRKRLEFSDDQLRALKEHANGLGLVWFASPWDVPSVHRLAAISRDYVKVASAGVTNEPLLRAIAGEKFRRVFLSTGMSYAHEVRSAAAILAGLDIVLMHCISAYPCKNELCHLSRLLKWRFPDPDDSAEWHVAETFGYSGHEQGILPSLIAAGLGATYIERHLTYDKTAEGSDHAASLDASELAELVSKSQEVEAMLGSPEIRPLPEEEPAMRKLRVEVGA